MKRLIATIVILTFAVALMAAESGPSETVGFVGREMPNGQWKPLSLPFTFEDTDGNGYMSLDDVFGDQLSGTNPGNGDQVLCMQSGLSATYAGPVFGWIGSLDSLFYQYSYWMYKNPLNPTDSVYIAGTVEKEVIDYGIIPGDGGTGLGKWTAVGIKEAGEVAIAPDNLDLLACGFTGTNPGDGDQILSMNTGLSSTYAGPVFGWMGSLTNIEPTHVYWLYRNSAHPAGFHWIYDPLSKGTKVGSKVKTKVITPVVTPKITPSTSTTSKVKIKKVSNPIKNDNNLR